MTHKTVVQPSSTETPAPKGTQPATQFGTVVALGERPPYLWRASCTNSKTFQGINPRRAEPGRSGLPGGLYRLEGATRERFQESVAKNSL